MSFYLKKSNILCHVMTSKLFQVPQTGLFVVSKSYCPFCDKVKNLFDSLGKKYELIELDVHFKNQLELVNQYQQEMKQVINSHTVPQIFFNSIHIGDCSKVSQLDSEAKLLDIIGNEK